MKHIVQALGIIAEAERKVEADLEAARSLALRNMDMLEKIIEQEKRAALAEIERRYAPEKEITRRAFSDLASLYALPQAKLVNAKRALTARLTSIEALKEEYFGELKKDTPKKTTTQMRRSIRRERERRARAAR